MDNISNAYSPPEKLYMLFLKDITMYIHLKTT
ncbi:hypothetical protein SPHINGOAX6_70384 [Sphingomonas sp. AX6]|nr:hypothetical protein SPHINGOAX6_70384 [Sphingomonas sp. AX6]